MSNLPPRPAASLRTSAHVVAFVGAVLLALGLVTSPASSTPGGVELGYGAAWLAARVDATGAVNSGAAVDSTATLQVAVSLASSGYEGDALLRQLGYISANADALSRVNGLPHAANLGLLLQVASATGLDPTDLGGFNAVSTLESSLSSGAYAQVLTDPAGVEAQSEAIIGLVAVGSTPDPTAIAWLQSQQCDATNGALTGSWMQRARGALEACLAAPADPAGSALRSTARGATALWVAGSAPLTSPDSYFDDHQRVDGGFFEPSTGMDTEATALVLQYLVVAGVNPETNPWAIAGGNPLLGLRAAMVACTSAGAGGFGAAVGNANANLRATAAAVQALAGGPVTELVPSGPGFVTAPLVCPVVTTTAPALVTTTPTTLPTAVSGVATSRTQQRAQVAGTQLARSGYSLQLATAGVVLVLSGVALRRSTRAKRDQL